MRKRIAERFPDDGILGEEFGTTQGTSGFQWVLDPIDGTKSFIHGVPLYTTLVAVLREVEVEVERRIDLTPLHRCDSCAGDWGDRVRGDGGGCWYLAERGAKPQRGEGVDGREVERGTGADLRSGRVCDRAERRCDGGLGLRCSRRRG